MIKKLLKIGFISALFLCNLFSLQAQTALRFDGVDDIVDCGKSTALNIMGNLTLELQVKQDTIQYYPGFASKLQAVPEKGYWLGGDDLGHALFYVANGGAPSSGLFITSKKIIADGNWHHIAGVLDSDTARIYIDGVLDSSRFVASTDLYAAAHFLIGSDSIPGDDVLKGDIDDVRLWSYPRSATEIYNDRNACLTGRETNLVALYHFEEASGFTANDITGHGYDGTLINMLPFSWVTGINCDSCDFSVNTGTSILTTVSPYHSTIVANESGASYEWIDCAHGDTIITNETNISFTPTMDGSYAVIVTKNGCTDTSDCVTITATGIEDIENYNVLSVYPNPSNGTFTIESPKEGSYSIKNELGQTIRTIQINATNDYRLAIENLSNGIYFIVGLNDKQMTRHKVVVVK